MISMSIRTNANELMRREALSGRYGVRCFDFFGEGEDAIVTYPNWNRIEQFIENNKNFPEYFEVLSGSDFDLGIDDAVLVAFQNDDRKVICSMKTFMERTSKPAV